VVWNDNTCKITYIQVWGKILIRKCSLLMLINCNRSSLLYLFWSWSHISHDNTTTIWSCYHKPQQASDVENTFLPW